MTFEDKINVQPFTFNTLPTAPATESENDGGLRPLISFCLFAYNQEQFIREAVEGALAQTYSPLEIILSDDCSTDLTFEIMKQVVENYRGPHTIVLNRNEKNLYIGAHANRIHQIAKGILFVGADGDDISLPNRVSELYKVYSGSAIKPSLLYSNAISIDVDGTETSTLMKEEQPLVHVSHENVMESGLPVFGCTMAIDRKIVESFPPLNNNIMAVDTVLIRRAHLLNGVCYVPKVLVKYRIHEGGVSQTMVDNRYRDHYLKMSLQWTEDRVLRNRQAREDINFIRPENMTDRIKNIERLEQIEKRRLKVLTGNFIQGAVSVVLEMIIARGTRMHMVKAFIVRWFPHLIKYQ